MSEDNRSAPRQRTLKGGVIAFNDGRSTIDCQVRNLSATGAQLKVASILGIPDRFTLVMGADRHECQVAWRRETQLGVAFAP